MNALKVSCVLWGFQLENELVPDLGVCTQNVCFKADVVVAAGYQLQNNINCTSENTFLICTSIYIANGAFVLSAATTLFCRMIHSDDNPKPAYVGPRSAENSIFGWRY